MDKNKYVLGKCDYNDTGRKSYKAEITWELENGNFSMCAGIWNTKETDYVSCGQCVDRVAKYFPHDKKAQRMAKIWERWNLNDMKAGCEHQRALGWQDVRINPSELPKTHANRDEKGIMAMWVDQEEHKDGLLCKPCPTCGYKYGSAWLKEELPQDVIEEIKSW